MKWIPKNKKTGQVYLALDDKAKAAQEAHPSTKGKYTYAMVPGSDAPKVERPQRLSEPVGRKKEEEPEQPEQ